MGRKSNSLFAILVIPKSIKRDNKLDELFGNSKSKPLIPHYICGTNYNISYSPKMKYIKIWKTLNGANNYLRSSVEKSLNHHYVHSDDFKNPSFEVVCINEEWNKHIDEQISIENTRHETLLERLENKKLK